MKVEVQIHLTGGGYFSIPQYDRSLFLQGSKEDIHKYITDQIKDDYDNAMRLSDGFAGFDYTSRAGAIKLVPYVEPSFKTIEYD